MLLAHGLGLWQRAVRMLNESSYSDVIGRGLLGVAANLALCTGWLAFDAGNEKLARRQYSEALLLADNAADAVLAVHVRTNLSMLSSYVARLSRNRGPAREGLRLAEQAAEEGRHQPLARLHTLVALRRANAASLLGDDGEFWSAITCARRELERGPGAADPTWIMFVDETEVTVHEAMGRANLGDLDGAACLLRETLDDRLLSRRNRAFRSAQLAAILARCGDVSGAVDEAMTVIPALEGGVASVRTLNELRPIRAMGERAATEEFCARFDAVEQAFMAV